MELFESLELWVDGDRDGPENMAIDDCLSLVSTCPILRVYGWIGSWVSIGYFGKADEIPHGRSFVRRPTGGGVVDHTGDWTYSLIVPRGFGVAEMPASSSYEHIHARLVDFLQARGVACRIVGNVTQGAGVSCFEHPVRHDVMDHLGRKIAGAGQRRNRDALLHQGTVNRYGSKIDLPAIDWAKCLAQQVRPFDLDSLTSHWPEIGNSMYATQAWNRKR